MSADEVADLVRELNDIADVDEAEGALQRVVKATRDAAALLQAQQERLVTLEAAHKHWRATTAEQFRRAESLEQALAEALERAAKVCDFQADFAYDVTDEIASAVGIKCGAERCAAAIRAMIGER